MADLIQKTDSLNDGRVKLNEAITQAEQADFDASKAKVDAGKALALSQSTQTQLDIVIVDGDSSVEAAQARIDEYGEAHPTLKVRVDDGFSKMRTRLNNSWFDVTSTTFGAKGDGLINDSLAIQKAIDQKTILFRTSVYIPAGRYLINEMIVIPKETDLILHPNATLVRGSGIYAVLTNGKSTDVFTQYNGNGSISIKGGKIDVNGFDIPITGNGIFFGHAENIDIKDITILNAYNAHHIELNAIRNSTVKNVKFRGFNHDGTRAYSEALQIDLAKNADVFPLFGAYDNTPCVNITIENCQFNNVGRAIGSHASTPNVFHGAISIINCTIDDSVDAGIHMLGWRNSTITGNGIYNNLKGFYFENCYEISFSDNRVKGSRGHGIEVVNSNTISMKGTMSTSNLGNGITVYGGSHSIDIDGGFSVGNTMLGVNVEGVDCKVSNVIAKRNGSHGIFVHDNKRNKINSNTISENGRHGLLLNNATYTSAADNNVHSNNQNNDGSGNIVLVNGSKFNRITNNDTKVGELVNKPEHGLLIASGCEDNVVLVNDFRSGGTVANFKDDGLRTVTTATNITS